MGKIVWIGKEWIFFTVARFPVNLLVVIQKNLLVAFIFITYMT